MDIFGLRVNEVSFQEVLKRVSEWVDGRNHHHIVSVNPEGVLIAQNNERYREVVNRVALALADGVGVVWAAKWVTPPAPPLKIRGGRVELCRITGVDLMLRLCEMAAKDGWKVYLVGGVGETACKTAEKLRGMYPGLAVEGEEGIPKQVTSHKLQVTNLIERINHFSPQLLFVALGQPKQELWIDDHLKEMPSVRVAMGVGGAFDFISGKVPRAPFIMRQMGLEWLWRLIVEPRRFPRIFNATVRFAWLVVKEKLTR